MDTNKLSQQESNQTTIVTPVNQRGRPMLLTLNLAKKRSSNIKQPNIWRTLQSYKNKKNRKENGKERHHLTYNILQSPRDRLKIKEDGWQAILETNYSLQNFSITKRTVEITQLWKINGRARILLSAKLSKANFKDNSILIEHQNHASSQNTTSTSNIARIRKLSLPHHRWRWSNQLTAIKFIPSEHNLIYTVNLIIKKKEKRNLFTNVTWNTTH